MRGILYFIKLEAMNNLVGLYYLGRSHTEDTQWSEKDEWMRRVELELAHFNEEVTQRVYSLNVRNNPSMQNCLHHLESIIIDHTRPSD